MCLVCCFHQLQQFPLSALDDLCVIHTRFVAIEFKNQLFYGTFLKAYVAAADFSRIGFDLYYRLVIEKDGKEAEIAVAKTGMVCFDYSIQKVVAVPTEAVKKLTA